MSQSDKIENDDTNIWDAFDDTVEDAEEYLKQAWKNYEFIQQTENCLSGEYISALINLDETVEEFSYVYEVTDAEFERADRASSRAQFLARVTQTYYECHQVIIKRRANVAKEWFDVLTVCVERADSDVVADQSSLRRQIQALEKLINAGKYGQLLASDRVELTDIENKVREFDQKAQTRVPTEDYVQAGLELVESFQEQYTGDLAELVREGVDKEAITVTDRVSEASNLETVTSHLEEDATTDDDVDAVGTTVDTYADVVVLTAKRRAKYELGKKLIQTIEDSSVSDDIDVEMDFHLYLNSFQLEPIEDLIKRLIKVEGTIFDTDRLIRLLAKHDGSVRRTIESLDRPTEELFGDLHDLLLKEEISDLEVRFE